MVEESSAPECAALRSDLRIYNRLRCTRYVMHTLNSSAPCPALKPYVRAFAQRALDRSSADVVQTMPASLEQVLQFEFGELSQIELDDGQRFTTYRMEIVGS